MRPYQFIMLRHPSGAQSEENVDDELDDSESHGLNDSETDGLDDSINEIGLAVDGAGFGAGAGITFVDPRSGPGGAELDGACASNDSTGSFPVFKYSFVR
jgi:hypothetical protein